MKPFPKLLSAAIAVTLAVWHLPVRAQATIPIFVTAAHREALQAWFRVRPGLRVLRDDECRCDDAITTVKFETRTEFHPYYAVADLNADDVDDFAVVVESGRGSRLIAVF